MQRRTLPVDDPGIRMSEDGNVPGITRALVKSYLGDGDDDDSDDDADSLKDMQEECEYYVHLFNTDSGPIYIRSGRRSSPPPNRESSETHSPVENLQPIYLSSRRYSGRHPLRKGYEETVSLGDGVVNNFEDIYRFLDRMCEEEMKKADWTEGEGRGRDCSAWSARTDGEDMPIMIYLDSVGGECEDPGTSPIRAIFIPSSGLVMDTTMLEGCRSGRGLRAERRLDILKSIQHPAEQNRASLIAANGVETLRPPSYSQILKQIQDWNDKTLSIAPTEESNVDIDAEKADVLKRLHAVKAELRGRFDSEKAQLRERIKAAKARGEDEEAQRLDDALRECNKKYFDACADQVQSQIKLENWKKKDTVLKDLLDITLLHATQSAVLERQHRPLPEQIQPVEDADSVLQDMLEMEFPNLLDQQQMLESLINGSRTCSGKALTLNRRIIAAEIKDPDARFEEWTRRLENPKTFEVMSKVRDNAHTLFQMETSVNMWIGRLEEGIWGILGAARKRYGELQDAYAYVYALAGGIDEKPGGISYKPGGSDKPGGSSS
ncbi:hypothetical protein K432DRAFT_441902 [Lepidopterella palustris CBS 459.81]|uniref:Uncharacterized protein n=1 Tax=Lepidopterella palustris CBS 459.81 TaxID=1314670 RepID=A0A8E2EDG7_9PEZI|nr:hypothetical protein K432DRAFT_441902 [Lepidopterella palustris CBS 459.81]